MQNSWYKTFMAYSEDAGYQHRIQHAKDLIASADIEQTALAFSGGKDSTVMLALVHEVFPGFSTVYHYDFGRPGVKAHNCFPEWMEHEFVAIVYSIIGKNPVIVTKRKNWTTVPLGCKIIPDDTFWVVGMNQIIQQAGHRQVFVGLRKEESCKRKRRIQAQDYVTIPELWPISDLTDLDVWTYLVSHDLKYCSAYEDKAALLGGYMGLRLTSLFRDSTAKVDVQQIDNILYYKDRR